MKKLKIYLAGKIAPFEKDWRKQLCVYGVRGLTFDELDVKTKQDNKFIYKDVIKLNNRRFDYTGPYTIGYQHGIYDGENTHGAVLNESYNYDDYSIQKEIEGQIKKQQKFIFENCINGINNADVVLAWITDTTCYGTIAEIGYANGKKPIFIAGDKYINELSFLYEMANANTFKFKNPKKAFEHLFKENKTLLENYWIDEKNEKKILRLNKPLFFGKYIDQMPVEIIKTPDGLNYFDWIKKKLPSLKFEPELEEAIQNIKQTDSK